MAWYGHAPRLFLVFVLAMTSPGLDVRPAVIFNEPNEIANLHLLVEL